MTEKVIKTIEKYAMLSPGDKVTAAVSGGADSLTLLRLLCIIKEKYSLDLTAAHINHCLRGADADADEQLVKKYCDEWGIKLFILRADVKKIAEKTGEGCEECGRRIRYEFLEKCAGKNGKIATAHTLSDCAETVIFNLTRGSGTKGMCGIPPVRGNIIRPLIDCTRAEIENFCHSEKIIYAVDKTNSDTSFSRNRIRANVIPELLKINPGFYDTLLGTVFQLRDEDRFLDASAKNLLKEARTEKNGRVKYLSGVLLSADPVLTARAVRIAAKTASQKMPERRHIELLCRFLESDGGVMLPGNTSATVKNGFLSFAGADEASAPDAFEIPLKTGEFNVSGGKIRVKKFKKDDETYCGIINNMLLFNLLDCAKIGLNPIFRNRRAGDRLSIKQRGVTKTLKKLFNESGLSKETRENAVILADDTGVLWVSGFGADERAAVDCNTSEYLLIEKI